jgi:hypothetical protein
MNVATGIARRSNQADGASSIADTASTSDVGNVFNMLAPSPSLDFLLLNLYALTLIIPQRKCYPVRPRLVTKPSKFRAGGAAVSCIRYGFDTQLPDHTYRGYDDVIKRIRYRKAIRQCQQQLLTC